MTDRPGPLEAELLEIALRGGAARRRAPARRAARRPGRRRDQVQPHRRRHRDGHRRREADHRPASPDTAPRTASSARRAPASRAPAACAWVDRPARRHRELPLRAARLGRLDRRRAGRRGPRRRRRGPDARGETFRAVRGRRRSAGRRAAARACRPAPAGGGPGRHRVQLPARPPAPPGRGGPGTAPELRDIRPARARRPSTWRTSGCGRMDAYYERGLTPWDLRGGRADRPRGRRADRRPPRCRPRPDLAVVASPGVFDRLQPLLDSLGAWHD